MSKAVVLTGFGEPTVLRLQDVADPRPGRGEVLIGVRAAGVGPTDVAIRAGRLTRAFPLAEGAILGFEAAGVVEAVGEDVTDARVGDEVLALLPHLGGYSELVTTNVWCPKPASVRARARRSSSSAPGAPWGSLSYNSRGRGGIRAVGAASEGDAELVRRLGGEPVVYGDGVFDRVRDVAPTVHAVIDAAGHGGIAEAVAATGDPSRVVTLVDAPGAAAAGAKMSEPGPDRAPDALAIAVPLLAAGELVLKRQTELPLADAAEAHRRLEGGLTHDKLVLIV